MRPAIYLALPLLGTALVGCSSSSSDGASAPKTGTATLRFAVSNGVRQSPNLVDALSGSVYGSLFKPEDVTLTGPVDGAQDVASVEATNVDLVTDTESSATWTSDPIPEGQYIFLGFYDVDGNGATDRSPDPGDPVTLPTTNKIEITAGQDATATATFDLVNN